MRLKPVSSYLRSNILLHRHRRLKHLSEEASLALHPAEILLQPRHLEAPLWLSRHFFRLAFVNTTLSMQTQLNLKRYQTLIFATKR